MNVLWDLGIFFPLPTTCQNFSPIGPKMSIFVDQNRTFFVSFRFFRFFSHFFCAKLLFSKFRPNRNANVKTKF